MRRLFRKRPKPLSSTAGPGRSPIALRMLQSNRQMYLSRIAQYENGIRLHEKDLASDRATIETTKAIVRDLERAIAALQAVPPA